MANDFAVKTAASQYPDHNTRHREFVIDLIDPNSDYTFVPLFITRPPPTGEAVSGSFSGTVLDEVAWRCTSGDNYNVGVNAKIAYKANGSAVAVDLATGITLDNVSDSLALADFAAMNGASNNDGFAPVIPDSALVGLVLSADLSGSGIPGALVLRLATREATG